MTTPPAPRPTSTSTHSTADIVCAVVLSTIQALLSFLAFAFSGLFMMASDSCGSPAECDSIEQTAWIAMFVVWGSIAVGAAITFAGMIHAGRRHQYMSLWPVFGTVAVVLGFFLGFGIVSSTGA
ncbi:hypothetical protein [Luteipulveratus halotolerans]|uniref:Major facilitator superfamily (MFS) profile domain-containing protein n=1 Tax=Luteipulveratus halotolerans TaxID=1631356 RepID=A0A0L6CEE1_9MICO|nr:hypothetical protein [Luteipulveratus halotolerans]KNX36246.1 hypothetical protein VV01_02355 [Luteipulveratus halotolerans]